jgi:hypothetical protein
MNTQNQNTSADLKARITERIQELAQATDAARVSEEMQRYLDMCSRFHQYSPCNVWLILMSQPNASYVAGFKKWQSLRRCVRKGEHGIPILAPIFIKIITEDSKEQDRLVGFKVVYVFDFSQTNGEPLPEPPDWKSPEKCAELQEKLILFVQSKGIQVQIKSIGRDIQGISLGGKVILDSKAGTKTLIHEIAHELLHQVEGVFTNRTIRELEAESVAYVVAKHFGLDGLCSPNYNALYGATAEMIMEHLERIRNTAAEIIKALESR